MTFFEKLALPSWLRRVLSDPADELTGWRRAVRYAINLTRHCAGELGHDKADQMAAALTYHTLFSLLPTLVLVLVALNAFVGPEERTQFKLRTVNWAVDFLKGEPVGVADATPALGVERKEEFEAVRQRLDAELQTFIVSLERISFGSIGLVGVLLFIYGSTGLLATIERSFNAVFDVDSGRPWYVRLPLYYTVITLGPIAILAGQWLEGRVIDTLQSTHWTTWLVGPSMVAAPLVSTWLAILVLYTLLPTAVVGKRAAIIGSLVAAVLLNVSRELFRLYVARAAISTLYGALALLPLFLLLLWLNWLIVLFGLELTYTLGAMRGRQFKRERYRQVDPQLVEPSWLVPVGALIGQSFARGQTTTESEISAALALPATLLRKLLQALVRAGLVLAIPARSETRYTLARPADRIGIDELLAAADSLLPRPRRPSMDAEPAWGVVDELRRADAETLRGRTLADALAASATDAGTELRKE